MPAQKGETWNESEVYRDAWTLREVRRVTTQGLSNQTPTYHTNITFSEDGDYFIFASERDGHSAIYRAHTPTGDITALIEPTPGMGSFDSMHKANGVAVGNGEGIYGTTMCMAPRSGWAVYSVGRSIRAVHIHTLEERILVPDIGAEWLHGVLSIDPTETYVITALMSAHPEIAAGQRPTRPYMEHFADGSMKLRIIQVPLAGGEVQTIYQESGCSSAHSPHCPTDPDLVLIDRDFPPRFWGGSDGKTNRIWTLRLSTGQLTELPPQDEARFQVHSGWTWDGDHVLYHGRSAIRGHYIGLIDQQGQTVREYAFRDAPHYGHVASMAGRPAIILDGNLTTDMLLWLYYDSDQPRIEVIARHGTDWGALPGQYPHPHPVSDSHGQWIVFNRGERGRTDVCVVKV
ncbi:MAG: hypothetical protein K8J31_04105 [Anaerolineae bacterium]|nr:hypothetical protein [Anaerolineae bacterium]